MKPVKVMCIGGAVSQAPPPPGSDPQLGHPPEIDAMSGLVGASNVAKVTAPTVVVRGPDDPLTVYAWAAGRAVTLSSAAKQVHSRTTFTECLPCRSRICLCVMITLFERERNSRKVDRTGVGAPKDVALEPVGKD